MAAMRLAMARIMAPAERAVSGIPSGVARHAGTHLPGGGGDAVTTVTAQNACPRDSGPKGLDQGPRAVSPVGTVRRLLAIVVAADLSVRDAGGRSRLARNAWEGR